ncbi:hypothetical protein BDZ94DRAFT_769638 [Collybia nuda]|uniref:Uncharacterized protein n=1 Tax=Collybia nuda TaxID=64659 RepID=A0A9P6CIJ1_9AGAR|nr:hypothetical protein BDZ94DRAFT_769638 [Collybia nuda]
MMPRPILKTSSSECFPPSSSALPFRLMHSPHVHFPPTPTLTTTQMTHSPFAYDRAPIVVSPNKCALPERGERMYMPSPLSPSGSSPTEPKGSYFHPRAFEACQLEALDQSPTQTKPPLRIPCLPDLTFSSSSESDDSDGCASPLNHSPINCISPDHTRDTLCILSPLSLHAPSQKEIDIALSFLPHPPSPVKDRRKPRKKGTGRALTLQARNESFQSTTNDLSLDGCLGGF